MIIRSKFSQAIKFGFCTKGDSYETRPKHVTILTKNVCVIPNPSRQMLVYDLKVGHVHFPPYSFHFLQYSSYRELELRGLVARYGRFGITCRTHDRRANVSTKPKETPEVSQCSCHCSLFSLCINRILCIGKM